MYLYVHTQKHTHITKDDGKALVKNQHQFKIKNVSKL